MVTQFIAPVAPNFGGQEAAVAGSSAAIFTATDRKIIEERTGELNRNREFLELLADKPLTAEVENEQAAVKPRQDVRELARRVEDHRAMLKHAPLYNPQERIEISQALPDTFAKAPEPESTAAKQPVLGAISQKIVALARELKLDAAQVFAKLTLGQDELHALISHIKELHLKRLFTEQEAEFNQLTEQISRKTLAAAKPEAQSWLAAQLDHLTLDAAEYKLNLLLSLQKMDFISERAAVINWLKKITRQLG